MKFVKTKSALVILMILISACSSQDKALDVSPRLEGLEDAENITSRLKNLSTSNDVISPESFDRSLRSKPKFKSKDSELNHKATLACINGEFKTGLKDLSSYSEIKSAQRLTVIGNCHFRQGAIRLALLHYDKALIQNKKYFPAQHNRAIVQLLLGNTKRALGELDNLYRNNPSSKVLRWNLARIYMKRRIYSKSSKYLSSLNRDNASDQDVLKGLAYSDLGRNRVTKSASYFNSVNFKNTRDPQDHFNYAVFLKRRNQKQKSLAHVKRALEEAKAESYPAKARTELLEVSEQLIKSLNEPAQNESKKKETKK